MQNAGERRGGEHERNFFMKHLTSLMPTEDCRPSTTRTLGQTSRPLVPATPRLTSKRGDPFLLSVFAPLRELFFNFKLILIDAISRDREVLFLAPSG
jgi:hypothetical protein